MHRQLDAVILAAGAGSRLAGIVPTGMKPLVVVNGEALIARLARQARSFVTGRLIVVVSPTNAAPIVDLLARVDRRDIDYVVQPTPAGPGEALLRGLALASSPYTLVLAGDNWMPDAAVTSVVYAAPLGCAVGVRVVGEPDVARRFTRFREHNAHGPSLECDEGPDLRWPGPWTVWCGPLVLPTENAKAVLTTIVRNRGDNEAKIGPYIGSLGGSAALVPVDAQDIGTPEALT